MVDKRKYTLEEVIGQMASLQCTIEEASGALKVSPSAFKKKLAENPHLKEIWERAPAQGRVELRRLQWRHANGFGPQAVAMTMHLSKHWLGEHDKAQLDVNANINLNTHRSATDIMLDNIKAELLSKEEQIELAELCDLVDEHTMSSLTTAQRVRFFSLVNKGAPNEAEEEAREDDSISLMLPAPDKKAA
jgi:hypothetical protein